MFQHRVHPKEHETQMRDAWSNRKSKAVTVIQSSNTPSPTTQPLAGKLSLRACMFSQSFRFTSVTLSLAKLLGYVYVLTLFMMRVCEWLFGFVPLGLDNLFPCSCLQSLVSKTMSLFKSLRKFNNTLFTLTKQSLIRQ